MNVWINVETLINYLSECNSQIYLNTRNCERRKAYLLHLVKVVLRIEKVLKICMVDKNVYEPSFLQRNWKAELLYLLSISKLIDINSYFYLKGSNVDSGNELCEELLCLYFDRPDDLFYIEIKNELTMALLSYAENKLNLEKHILPNFIKKYYSKLLNYKENEEVTEIPFICNTAVYALENSNMFTYIISHSFNEEGTSSPSEAIKNSNNFQPKRDGNVLEPLFKQMYSLANKSTIVQFLRSFLLECNSNSSFNWKNIALMIMTIINNNDYSDIKKIITELIEVGLEMKHSFHIYCALLVGRICSLPNGPVTYIQWFTSTFSSESHRPLNSEDKAKFFLTCLSDIVYFEEAQYLKAHVNKVPHVPSSCQTELSEYLQIAKSCLLSMNESIELGFFENVEGVKTTDNDVNRLVKDYEIKKKLPQAFLASLQFRRQYFEKQLLPKLLSLCPGPNSTHHTIIKDLSSLGKISAGVFSKHLQDCSRNGNAKEAPILYYFRQRNSFCILHYIFGERNWCSLCAISCGEMGEVNPQQHHIRGEEVHTRPLYRRGRRATAVKVFTVADESVHMLIFGVPSVNLIEEIKRITEPYGEVTVEKVDGYPDLEEFTDLFHIRFSKVTIARAAKRRLDGLEFFGGILHVCYAPELETIDETRSKLNLRRRQMVNSAGSKKFRSSDISNSVN